MKNSASKSSNPNSNQNSNPDLNGFFWISWKDFVANFIKLYACLPMSQFKGWFKTEINGEFRKHDYVPQCLTKIKGYGIDIDYIFKRDKNNK